MSTLTVDVDKELAEEYCKKLRELFPMQYDDLENKALMVAFVKDRLSEELKFVSNELRLTS